MIGQYLRSATLFIIVSLFLFSCNDEQDDFKINPEFETHISFFTSGMISRTAPIRLGLIGSCKEFTAPGQELKENPFSFSPSVEGKAYWLDDRTIEFRPDEYLKSGQKYEAHFNLSAFRKVPKATEDFEFRVITQKQHYEVAVKGIETYRPKDMVWNKLQGTVNFADFIEDEKVESIVKIQQMSKDLKVTWTHSVDGKWHRFLADSVERKEAVQQVQVTWDGSAYELKEKGELNYEIPSLKNFTLMNVELVNENNTYLLLHFSDPLDQEQDLKGLLHFKNGADLNFQIEGNKVKLFPRGQVVGERALIIEPGIKNILGYKFKTKEERTVQFVSYKPDVEMLGSGVVLPSSDGLVFPFKAVNLKAVDVKIIRIFENNIGQFFQVNRLDQNRQIRRVGRPVLKKKVPLNSDHVVNKSKWNNYFLDLEELIKVEPGAIYQVELSFKKAYSLYPCESDDSEESKTKTVQENWDEEEEESSFWDYSEDYYYYNNYRWSERNDPCTESYFISRRGKRRNIFATNLGVVAKAGKDKKMLVVVTDMRTTKPVAGAQVEIRNYQNQVIASGSCSAEGVFSAPLKNKAYLVVVKNGKERGYLRVDDATALSTSKFDVSGQVIQKGLKGFIYGERGVWRPGDTLFLSFILEDEEKTLPANHPVHLQLFNPSGKLMHSQVSRKGLNGFHTWQVVTNDAAPTGSWRATVKVGGATFTKHLRIETIKPNRLKVQLNFGTEMLSSKFSHLSGKLSAKWLHGAPARKLKTRVELKLVEGATKFPKHQEYSFTDPGKRFQSEESKLFEGKLDEKGNALVTGKVKVNGDAPGMLKAIFTSRVFEEGGDFSTDRYSIPYSPYEKYVGLRLPKGDRRGMLLTDTNHVGELVSVDAEGKPVDIQKLKVKIYKIQWRWWWEASSNSIGSYNSNSYRSLVYETTTSTTNGRGQFKFRVNYPEWGRYYVQVTDPNGHSTGKIIYMDWPGWAGRGNRETPGGAHLLMFSSDKKKYKVGDNAKIIIPGSGKGRAFVSIENGSKILQTAWVDVDSSEVVYNLPITADMAPNVYANVTLLQPHKHNNSLPIRLYGVIPLLVEDDNTLLNPHLKLPKEFKPETTGRVIVSEKDGKAMTYTLAVVDEGLLDLTRFKTPNAHPVFYAREALGIKTWDYYDYVIGAFGGKLEGVLSIGGDGLAKGKKKDKIKRFKPMVRFIGPFKLEAGEKKSHLIDIPNYVGSVRTMVVAGQNGAYGNAEQATPVRKPLMVLATLPRVVGPKEKLKLPVTVFAMDKKVKKVQVKVSANNKFVKQKMSKTVTFKEIGDQVVEFDLEVGTVAGDGKVKIEVSGAGEKATTTVDIPVRHSNTATSVARVKEIAKGKTDTIKRTGHGMPGTQSFMLELSRVPNIDLESRLGYLIGYPHGCAEQTTSRAFPQLYLGEVLDLTQQQKERAKQHVVAAIQKLVGFQNPDGGFGYWSGRNSGDYVTSYIGHFLVEAKNQGYSVPEYVLKKWKKYQKSKAQAYSSRSDYNKYVGSSDYAQAYRLYSMALAGAPAIGSMNRLKERNKLDKVGCYLLAYAYFVAGEATAANNMISKGNDIGVKDNYRYHYGSSARNNAVMLEVLANMGKSTEAHPLLKKVAGSLGSRRYMNTNAVAMSLSAIAKYVKRLGGQGAINAVVKIDGKSTTVKTAKALKQVVVTVPKQDGAPITIINNGQGVLFATLNAKGVQAPGSEKAVSKNMKVLVQYLDLDNNVIDHTRLLQGTDFKARVTVTNIDAGEYLNDVALTEVFPSGWQILNKRMGLDPGESTSSYMDYEDFRDDRAMCYFGLSRRNTYNNSFSKVFEVKLNASYIGKFYLPGVTVETMYDNEHKASTKGTWVEVVNEK